MSRRPEGETIRAALNASWGIQAWRLGAYIKFGERERREVSMEFSDKLNQLIGHLCSKFSQEKMVLDEEGRCALAIKAAGGQEDCGSFCDAGGGKFGS